MEGKIGAILGLRLNGRWFGWLGGKHSSCTEAVSTVRKLMKSCIGCVSIEVHCPGLPIPNVVLWCCERHR